MGASDVPGRPARFAATALRAGGLDWRHSGGGDLSAYTADGVFVGCACRQARGALYGWSAGEDRGNDLPSMALAQRALEEAYAKRATAPAP